MAVTLAGEAPAQDRWLATFLIALAGLTVTTADQALFSYALSDIGKAFGVPLQEMGWLVAASFALAAIGVPISGMLTDRIGRRWAFTLLLTSSALCVGLHAFAQEYYQIVILRILGFTLSAGLFPVCTTLVLETAPERIRGMATGAMQMAYPLGFFTASVFAAPLLEAGGWRTEFLIAFAVIPLALFMGTILREPSAFLRARTSQEAAPSHRSLLLQAPYLRWTIICMVGTFLLNLGISAFIYFVPAFMTAEHGFSTADAARISGMAFAIGAVGYLLSSAVGEFVLSRRTTLSLWCLLGGAAFISAVWLGDTRFGLIVGLGVAVTFLFGSEAVRMPLIAELYPTEIRVTGTAIGGSVGVSLGSVVSPIVVTAAQPVFGWQWAFTIFCGVPLAIGALIYLMLPNTRTAKKRDSAQ